MQNDKHTITLFEACEILNRSKKTLSRYVRQERLHPIQVKSRQGTLEYRFSREDLDNFKIEQTRRDRTDTPDETGHTIPRWDGMTEEKINIPVYKAKTDEKRRDTQDRTDETDEEEQYIYFNEEPTESAKNKEEMEETGQDRQDKTRQTGQDETDKGIVEILKETVNLLKGQLTTKDKQIGSLNETIDNLTERQRETNILIGQLQNKVLVLEGPKKKNNVQSVKYNKDSTKREKGNSDQRAKKIKVVTDKEKVKKNIDLKSQVRKDEEKADLTEKTSEHSFNKKKKKGIGNLFRRYF